jgi:predicted Zn-ribbon and HTH transcriptional regulator
MNLSVPSLIFLYVAALLAAIAVAAIYTELRRRLFEPTPSEDSIFRCRRCGYVYTDDAGVDRSRCSQCGQTNQPIKF